MLILDYKEVARVCKELYPDKNTDWDIRKATEFMTEECGLMVRVETTLREPDGRRMTCFVPAEAFNKEQQ